MKNFLNSVFRMHTLVGYIFFLLDCYFSFLFYTILIKKVDDEKHMIKINYRTGFTNYITVIV